MKRLLEVGPELTSELDLPAVLDRLLETARELTGAQYAAIGVLDERRRTLEQFVTAGIDETTRAAIGALPRGHGILGLLIDRPQPLRLDDVTQHPRSYGFPAGHPPMTSFLGLPITIRGEVWGNLYLTDKADGGAFTDDDMAAVAVLATWAAVAIDNARLFADATQQRVVLERAVRSLRTSMEIAIAVGDDTDLTRNLQIMVSRGRELVGAQALLIWLLNGDELSIAAVAGSAQVGPGAVIPLGGSMAGRAIDRTRSIRIDDTRTMLIDPTAYAMPVDSPTLIVPLIHRGEGIGVLMAFGDADPAVGFDQAGQRALEAFAVSAATTVAIARSVEAKRLHDTLAAAESERRRWARELHDETLQGLAALKLSLVLALKARPVDGWPLVEAAVEQLATDIAGLRAIIADLRPAALDQLGLEPALRALIDRVSQTAGLATNVSIDLGEQRLSADVETIVYRVAQEAMTNVVKHARASRVDIGLIRVDRRLLRLTVEDDGVGPGQPAAAGARPGEGFGILGMRERAALKHGTLGVTALSHGGTRVTLELAPG
ncbi:MAG: GAF domain-containing sensor histidine kinase [Solirubrobacteraceae bacterium]|nr:GAF domain-containing sensor histidine kinase [Solirubrobacteraceae bacterium]